MRKKPLRTRFFVTASFLAASLVMAVASLPAYAGFEMVAPAEKAVQKTVPSEKEEGNVPLIPAMPSAQPIPVKSAPVEAPPEPPAPEDKKTAENRPVPPKYADALGFGKDLPLPIALRQIVPPDYPIRFGPNVNPGIQVNWQGGAPWNDVLVSALAPHGLSVSIDGKTVSVINAPKDSAVMTSPGAVPTARSERLAGQAVSSRGDGVARAGERKILSFPPLPEPVYPAAEDTADFGAGMKTSGQAGGRASGNIPAPETTGTDSGRRIQTGFYPGEEKTWTAGRGATLKSILAEWCRTARVELHWSAEYDYPLIAAFSFNGTFANAVATLLGGLADARPKPIARLYPNEPYGPAVLFVETR